MSNDVETYDCPSPDCSRTIGAREEFTEHINTEHAGEYQRDDWPDTEAGRQARRDRDESTDTGDE
ncbi:hypothetical protein C491_13512 [Natronococcus amylolyticus DSM 10524]|uniref:C2H2-type domain-containing protein n=1 Tax=Natronococcus amylolyticus DSM 10524 TaxID=1227497 RepID=L9X2Y9_9EURY|nr:hypothetical protein [Natronococcus amylolyticus]ELY55972.1 hypothetical protein C491_13512 [Natronococcus amylolyticus DSM 10524]